MNARPAAALGLCFALFSTGLAVAEPGPSAQRKACTPDAYRLCAGEIPMVRGITDCLRRHKDNLSEACKAVLDLLPNCSLGRAKGLPLSCQPSS
jgi:hypothetical protein